MSRRGRIGWAWVLGIMLGIAALPVAFLIAPVPRGTAALGLDLKLTPLPTGEVALPAGPIAGGTGMTAGSAAKGQKTVRNQTGQTLTVRVRALPASRDLDGVLRVRVRVDGLPVFAGTLGELRRWTDRWFQLRRGERRQLQIDARLPASQPRTDYQGRIEDVALELQARPRRD